MTRDTQGDSPQEMIACENCRALNPPNSIVCRSCGVNLADFHAAAPRIQEIRQSYTVEQRERLAQDASDVIADKTAQNRQLIKRLIWIAVIVGAIILVLGVMGAAFTGYQVRLRAERLAADYAKASDCLAAEDFLCARNRFSALLAEDTAYPKAREGLLAARYGVSLQHLKDERWQLAFDELQILLKESKGRYRNARELLNVSGVNLALQYAQVRKWGEAVNLLDSLLEESPGDSILLGTLKTIYDHWIADAVGRGNWLVAASLALQRSARFPEEKK